MPSTHADSSIPPIPLDGYDRKISGVIGTFGSGLDLRVYYLQASLPLSYLSTIKLVQEIPGSDRWPVRDLFQREVDVERVENGILPWLQDPYKVKFFNPLTLTLVPIDRKTHSIIRDIPKLVETTESTEGGQRWRCLEWNGYYRFKCLESDTRLHNEYAILEWNADCVHVVAIDGQHRLSALKLYLQDRQAPDHDEFLDWQVPVVITGLDHLDVSPADHCPSLLDVVRNIFVTINTQAKTPSRSRQILLDDESIIHVCTQEVLEYSHQNDAIDETSEHEAGRLPLLFWDWRGESHEGNDIRAPAAVKPITELADWLSWYVLDEDFTEYQQEVFDAANDAALGSAFKRQSLTADTTRCLRDRFSARILPAVAHLLETFTPYQAYCSQLRQAERVWGANGASYRHALARLRFGSHTGHEDQAQRITDAYSEIVDDICDLKKATIPTLIGLDIGMRGIMWAFGELKLWYNEWEDVPPHDGWLPFSRWFTAHLNSVVGDQWFGRTGNQHRLHITRDAADNVVNHRLSDAHKALGPLVALLVCAYAFKAHDIVDQEMWDEAWDAFADNTLFSTVRGGHLKRYRADMRIEHPDWSTRRIREAAEPKANRSARTQLRRLKEALPWLADG